MSTKIIALTVPATSGFGPATDISDLAGNKTVQLSGTFSGSYILYVSHDGNGYVPVLSFDSGGPEPIKKILAGAFRYAKILSLVNNASGVTANIAGLEDAGANTFATVTLPSGHSGTTNVVDLGLINYQLDTCTIIVGSFTGEIVLEGSLDGVRFNPLGSWKAQSPQAGLLGQQSLEFSPIFSSDKIRYIRATVVGITTSAVTLSVGGCQDTTLTPTIYAAVVALAVAQSTAIITRIGLLEYICANNVDPSVNPPAELSSALVGARVTTVDGTKSWIKYGTSNNNWRSLNETRVTKIAPAGGPYNKIDCDIVVPLDKGVLVDFNIEVAGAGTLQWGFLSLNGVIAPTSSGTILLPSGSASTANIYAALLMTGGVGTGSIKIGPSIGGSRWAKGCVSTTGSGSYGGVSMGHVTIGALTQVGIITAGDTVLAAGSVVNAVVREFDGIF